MWNQNLKLLSYYLTIECYLWLQTCILTLYKLGEYIEEIKKTKEDHPDLKIKVKNNNIYPSVYILFYVVHQKFDFEFLSFVHTIFSYKMLTILLMDK